MGLDALSIRGNADRALLEDPGEGLADQWVADQLEDRHREYLANLPETVELDVDGLGQVLFCHGSPRSDEEMILKTTPDEWLRDMLRGVEADGWPKATEIAAENIRTVPSEEEALSFFEDIARRQWAERSSGR